MRTIDTSTLAQFIGRPGVWQGCVSFCRVQWA